jgi:hypothetical protein
MSFSAKEKALKGSKTAYALGNNETHIKVCGVAQKLINIFDLKCEVFTAVKLEFVVFWVVAPCSVVVGCLYFVEDCAFIPVNHIF